MQYVEHYIRAEAVKVEVEAMKAANEERARRGEAQAYPEEAFLKRAVELNNIAERINETQRKLS